MFLSLKIHLKPFLNKPTPLHVLYALYVLKIGFLGLNHGCSYVILMFIAEIS